MTGLLSDFAQATDILPKRMPRVGIVGGGFAGLACDYELSAAGYSVEVFESRNRLGGRVHSMPEFAPGQMVEYGAELRALLRQLWLDDGRQQPSHLTLLSSQKREPSRNHRKQPRPMGFEFDVEKTKDGHLVCIHDGTVDRTANGTGKEVGINGVLTFRPNRMSTTASFSS